MPELVSSPTYDNELFGSDEYPKTGIKWNLTKQELLHSNLERMYAKPIKEDDWKEISRNELDLSFTKRFIPTLKRNRKQSKAFLKEKKDKRLKDDDIEKRYKIVLAIRKDEDDELRTWLKVCIKDTTKERYHLITSVNYRTEEHPDKRFDNKPLKNKKAESPQDGKTMNSLDKNWYIIRAKMLAPLKFWKSLNSLLSDDN